METIIKISTALLLLFVLSFTSCTIEKRLYKKGYHIETSFKKKRVHQPTVRANNTVKIERKRFEKKPINATAKNTVLDQVKTLPTTVITKKKQPNIIPIRKKSNSDNIISSQKKGVTTDEDPAKTKKNDLINNPLVIFSFALVLLSFALALFFFFFLLIPLPAILALPFGVAALNQFKKYPGVYKNKGFAITAIIVGYFACIFSITILVAVSFSFLVLEPLWLVLAAIFFAIMLGSTIALVNFRN